MQLVDTTKPAPLPIVCSGTEALTVLDAADKAGLLGPAGHQIKTALALGVIPDKDAPAKVNEALASGDSAPKACDWLSQIAQSGDVIEVRALRPDGRADALMGRLDVPAERAALQDFIRASNGLANIYVGINPRRAALAGSTGKANAGDVIARQVVVVDLDFKDAANANDPDWVKTIAALSDLGPVSILDSGNGAHVWFTIDRIEGADLAASQAPLARAMARIRADDMADLPRIARLPYTVNLPNAGKRARGNVPKLAIPRAGYPQPGRPKRWPVADLCVAFEALAVRLALPGKQQAGSAAGTPGTGGVVKTGRPAPSADLLEMMAAVLPNDPNNPKHDRDYWVRGGHAFKGAAVEGGLEAEGREAWLAWSAKWGGDPADAERFWDTCGDPHVGWGDLRKTLEVENPQGHRELDTAEDAQKIAQLAATTQATLAGALVQPVAPINPNQIPPREFLYGYPVVRRMISILVAPGGAGKSALVLVRAVAMATGRELLKGEKPIKPLKIWMHNAEDDRDELNRRLAGVLLHYGLDYADLGGRLIMTSGRDLNLVLASMGKDGAAVVPGVIDGLVDQVKGPGVDVLILDPLGAMHTLPENSNEAVNVLAKGLRELAERAKVAIVLVHHTSKVAAQDMNAAGAGAARGASALVDAARVVEQVAPMAEKEAARFGIAEDDRRGYMRVDNGKSNMAPAAQARWLRMVSVALNNGTADYPAGDRVGVVEHWTPPGPVSGSPSDLYLVQQAIGQADPFDTRLDTRANRRWVGWVIATALSLDVGVRGAVNDAQTPRKKDQTANLVRVRSMLAGWLGDGGLIRVKRHDQNRKDAEFVVPGKPAIIPDVDTDGDVTEGETP